jgi:phosphoserine aminotransferase
MLTFNPGPSQISPEIKQDIHTALDKHLLQISHRSLLFSEISKKAVEGLRTYFNVPADYKIFYTTSATEAMKLSLENCCEKKSFHFVNGSFSNLYAKIANSLHKETVTNEVTWGTQNDFQNTKISADCDFITITHNETSTGVMCNDADIKTVREKYPEAILAVDITSSAGGVKINISNADIWCFSVQKCLGLPAGLGVIFVSPRAYERSIKLLEKKKKEQLICLLEQKLGLKKNLSLI